MAEESEDEKINRLDLGGILHQYLRDHVQSSDQGHKKLEEATEESVEAELKSGFKDPNYKPSRLLNKRERARFEKKYGKKQGSS